MLIGLDGAIARHAATMWQSVEIRVFNVTF